MTVVLPVDAQRPDPGVIERAAACLRAGGLVAFPTETVYGLGVHALDRAAVRRLFAAKGRPAHDPLIVHVASLDRGARAGGGDAASGGDAGGALLARAADARAGRRARLVPDEVTAGLADRRGSCAVARRRAGASASERDTHRRPQREPVLASQPDARGACGGRSGWTHRSDSRRRAGDRRRGVNGRRSDRRAATRAPARRRAVGGTGQRARSTAARGRPRGRRAAPCRRRGSWSATILPARR